MDNIPRGIQVSRRQNKNGKEVVTYTIRIERKDFKVRKSFFDLQLATEFLEEIQNKLLEHKRQKNLNLDTIIFTEQKTTKEIIENYIEIYKLSKSWQDFFNKLDLIYTAENFNKYKKLFEDFGYTSFKQQKSKN